MSATSRFGAALVASCVAVVAFTLFLAVRSGTDEAKTVSDLVLAAGALVAGGACARAASRQGPDARGWRLLAVAAIVWAAADVVWTVYGITRDHACPFPSVADIGFVGYAIPVALGLLSFPRGSERPVSFFRMALDALGIASCVLFISWAEVLGPVFRSESPDLLSRVTALAYPFADTLIASLVLALGMRRPASARLPWVFLGGGLVTLAVFDSIYVARTVAGSFTSGTPLYTGWLVAFLLIALATIVPTRASAVGRSRLGRVEELLPYVPFGVALAISADKRITFATDPVLFSTGLVCALVFAVRQVLIVIENLTLRDDLEAKVEERTAELRTADERFRALVQTRPTSSP
jgi:two-component system sensor histidine kinase/response regulator